MENLTGKAKIQSNMKKVLNIVLLALKKLGKEK